MFFPTAIPRSARQKGSATNRTPVPPLRGGEQIIDIIDIVLVT
jgi:hypothetical protein